MNFKAKTRSKTRRAKKSKAHTRYGRTRKVQREALSQDERKAVVSYSLPNWQIEWINLEAEQAGMSKSTFVATMVETTKLGMDQAREEERLMNEQAGEDFTEED